MKKLPLPVLRFFRICALTIPQIRTIFQPSPSRHEGRFAIVTKRGAGCDGRLRRQASFGSPDENAAAYGEVVWSWRRDPGVTLAVSPAGNGGKKGRSPGRVRISRKPIARGRPGCLGCTCSSTRVHFCSTPTHTGLRAQSAPGLPCALCQREGQRIAKLGRKRAAGMRGCVSQWRNGFDPGEGALRESLWH